MTSIKTYLMNDKSTGEYKMKQKKSVSKIFLKNTLDDIKRKKKSKEIGGGQIGVYQEIQRSENAPKMWNYLDKTAMVKMEDERKLKKLISNIGKEEGGSKKLTKHEELQRKFFNKICSIVGVYGHPHGKSISFDKLDNAQTIRELFSLQEELREAFPSSKLTALHSNAVKKQSFPGVNIVRQIFKEMGYKLKPVNYSEGYLGAKKLLRREYQIIKV